MEIIKFLIGPENIFIHTLYAVITTSVIAMSMLIINKIFPKIANLYIATRFFLKIIIILIVVAIAENLIASIILHNIEYLKATILLLLFLIILIIWILICKTKNPIPGIDYL
ncbi:hypothetical protein ACFL56_00410 [Candidatus Margulisiibacteriota bacterium]